MSTTVLYIAVGEDGSITLPPEMRQALGVRPGDEVAVSVEEGSRRIAVEPKGRDLRDLVGILSAYARPEGPLTVEEMNEAIAAYVAADHARIVGLDRG